jgi:hypothetical protein
MIIISAFALNIAHPGPIFDRKDAHKVEDLEDTANVKSQAD